MHMARLFARLTGDRNGNIAITFAILIVPVLLAVGAALDYSMAYDVRQRLQHAADAAAISAIAEQSPGVIASLQSGNSGHLELATKDAQAWFDAEMTSNLKAKITDLNFEVERSGSFFTSVVTYEAEVPTSFMKLAGLTNVTVSGEARATYAAAKYIDFYMFLDNSPSMGLGATSKDIVDLQRITANQPKDANCAFACHIEGSSNDYYALAKMFGITTRIEMVARATEAMVKTARDTRRYSDQYAMAVYSLGEKAQNAKLTEITDLTTDLDAVAAAAAKVDLMSIPDHKYPNVQTDLVKAIKKLGKIIDRGGSGSSAADRDKVLFMVTDGVEDTIRGAGCIKKLHDKDKRCQAPLDATVCQDVKDKGIRIAVLYTTYEDVSENSWYRYWIKPFREEIGPQLKACASAGLYFEVSPEAGITEAMNALFQKIINTPRLTM